VVFVSIGGRAAGFIAVADPIKASAPDAVRTLREEGLQVLMLTATTRTTAEAVAREVGIDEVEAEVLPEQKRSQNSYSAGGRPHGGHGR